MLPASPRIVAAATLPAFPDLAWRAVFGTYRDLIADVSECPLAFHYAAFLSLIAAEFGDRVRRFKGTSLYPNFFIFCNGRTGAKKTAAVRILKEHIIPHLPALNHSTFSSVSSAEGLIRVLAHHPNVLLRLDEIADFFKTANRTGNRIEPILNQAFDLDPLQTIVKRKAESLSAVDYILTIHANGTPEHVRLELSEALFAGGVLNRFLVFAADPTGKCMPEMLTPDVQAAKELAEHIGAIVEEWHKVAPTRGSVSIETSDEAKALHAEWYTEHEHMKLRMPEMEAKALTRLDAYVKKLAMVYCLVETPPSTMPVVTAPQMAAALSVVAYCQASMLWTVRGWHGVKSIGQQADDMAEKRVESFLQTHGCSTERTIYRELGISSSACGKAANALSLTGVVTIINDRPRMVHYMEKCKCFPR